MKVALVNIQTEMVENIIVASVDDLAPEGYKLVEIPVKNKILTEEEQAIIDIIKDVDPEYVPEPTSIERVIIIGETKWNETNGFYGDEIQFS